MPIEILKGNLFESGCQTLVNPINCVGKMGKGLALEFKNNFGHMYKDYTRQCGKSMVRLGQPYLYTDTLFACEPWIINFPTVYHWRDKGSIENIEKGLIYLSFHYKKWGVTSLAVPALGCGCAGLSWNKVKPILLEHFEKYQIPVKLYQPY